jgi:hypothetical protein
VTYTIFIAFVIHGPAKLDTTLSCVEAADWRSQLPPPANITRKPTLTLTENRLTMGHIVDDPFTPQPPVPHAAFVEVYEPPFNIYEQLFDDFFASDEFCHWSSGKKHWQLHCYGGPGCGKV